MSEQSPPSSSLGRVVGLNLTVLLIVSLPIRFSTDMTAEGGLGGMILLAFWIIFHFIGAMLVGVFSKRPNSRAWYLGGLLVLMVGFGTCIATYS